ncbi:type IV toxin-antitoxin system AbiEi family antitoxin domain-containing protein [Aeromicrobium endophyticum]|uniref:type IV toxin-antitoxin system AbiEi family antitoxin domain-containing protein n=1 Tax=Aeromicrobium endophyticum TaxID=2292704 RepID=UPI00360E868E
MAVALSTGSGTDVASIRADDAGSPGVRPPRHHRSPFVAAQHGVMTRAQALTLMTRHQLYRLVSSGRWARPARGVFVSHTGPRRLRDDQAVAAGHGGTDERHPRRVRRPRPPLVGLPR